ncbi:Periplasmic component of amino acid ABC-type transporter/signal transduction system [Paraburkholderia piptadeniae]|uniref:Periplasmic component of amino acid ABC-type transporter/signal transduction system n=1 Tax=Paraburkholderia piptadeniae TaxID=1701573 RepID=A0A1N7SQ34_9BURK|nr:transporter substrate-binding domain-containing protein [Paraburkholderia piptadeniae]SIT49420.1 Periplasmic component of amino acid ABC-type transporter/signal transduction system [Paraburkholderia piptadeniae]
MTDTSRRTLLAAGLGSLAGAAGMAMLSSQPGGQTPSLIPSAHAQATGNSTWERIQKLKVLRAGAAIQEPWYFKDPANGSGPGTVKSGQDTWRGVGPVIAAEIARSMGVQLQIVETTWGNASAGIQSGQFDFMLCLDGNPTRALALDFVPTPLLWYPLAVLLKGGLTITTWAQANDPKYRWGVILGSSSDTNLTRAAPKSQITRFQNASEMNAAFQSGRIDGIFSLGPTLELTQAKLNVGTVQVLTPRGALPAGVAIRQEVDQRWKSYLTTAVSFFYNTGFTQSAYEQFLAYRGVPENKVLPIMRERWS